jgi:hypothetical protein
MSGRTQLEESELIILYLACLVDQSYSSLRQMALPFLECKHTMIFIWPVDYFFPFRQVMVPFSVDRKRFPLAAAMPSQVGR